MNDRYPLLHAPQRWEWAGVEASFSTEPPPDELITKVHLVGFVGQRIVVCRDARPVWFLPGGTREPGESLEACADRELREEAGVRLAGPLRWIGAHYCVSYLAAPYRPWQPHPASAWLYCHADVRVEGTPTNPSDAEQVLEVRLAEPDEAAALVASDNAWGPELVALARELRGSRPDGVEETIIV